MIQGKRVVFRFPARQPARFRGGGNGGRDRDRTCDPYDVNSKIRRFRTIDRNSPSVIKMLIRKGYLRFDHGF